MSSKPSVGPSSRTVRETANEFAGLCAIAVFAGVVIPLIELVNFSPQGTNLAHIFTNAGKSLLAQVGWSFPLTITVLLGFFAVLIGGQLFASQEDSDRLRRTLGFTAESIAAAGVPVMVYVSVYCLTSPQDWASLITVVPAFGLIVFLSLQLGRFNALDDHARVRELRKRIEQREKRIAELKPIAQRPLIGAIAVNVIFLVATHVLFAFGSVQFLRALGVHLPESSPQTSGQLVASYVGVGVYFAVVAVSLAAALRSYFVDLSRTRWVPLLIVVGLWVLVAGGILIGLTTTADVNPVAGGISFAVPNILVIASLRQPRRAGRWRLLGWSLRSGAASSAVRTLERTRAKYADDLEVVQERLAQQKSQPVWRDRFWGILQWRQSERG